MHLEPKCLSKHHLARKVCITKDCQVPNPFLCGQSSCRSDHKKQCEIIPYKKLIKQFHKMQGLFTQQIMNYQQRVQQTFEELIKGLRTEFMKFREQFEQMQMTNKISEIYQKIKQRNENQLNAKIIYKALTSKRITGTVLKVKNQLQMKMLKKDVVQIFSDLLLNLPPYYSLKNQITTISSSLEPGMNKVGQIKQQFMKDKNNPAGLLKDHYKYFEQMLGKHIYNIQLLYRATEHNFDARIFHQNCDGIANTITVAQTEFGNIVIGHCVFPWQSPEKFVYKQDNKGQCFLLSPDLKLRGKKFTPSKIKFAIGMHKDYGPSFGDDFVIYDKAHHSNNCWSNFPDVYVCKENEVPHTLQTIKQFVGVADHFQKFNLREWEVFKISYNANEQIQSKQMREYRKIKYN